MDPGSDARGQAACAALTFVKTLDFSRMGYEMVALFVFTWTGAEIVWRAAQLERRRSDLLD